MPEISLLLMALILFFMTLGNFRTGTVQAISLVLAAITLVITIASLGTQGLMFYDAYQIDALSQLFKVVIVLGLFLVFFLGTGLTGIEEKLHTEYNMLSLIHI